MKYKHTVEKRFIKYAKIDTTADPNSTTFPSSEIQKDLGRLLVNELKEMGAADVEMDQWAFPTHNSERPFPTQSFAHRSEKSSEI